MTTPEYSLKYYRKRWFIDDGSGGAFGQASRLYNFLTCTFEDVPPDTVEFLVREGPSWDLKIQPAVEKKVIGKFELLRQRDSNQMDK